MPRLDGTGPYGIGPKKCCNRRKFYCEKRQKCYNDNANCNDYLEEKDLLEKRLKEINNKLNNNHE